VSSYVTYNESMSYRHGSKPSQFAVDGTPWRNMASVMPNLEWKRAAFFQSLARIAASPGVAPATALATFTRARVSLSLRSADRSSASRESSGGRS